MNVNVENLRRRLAACEQKNVTLQFNLDAQTVEVNQLTTLYSKLKQEYAIVEREKEILQHELEEALERHVTPIVFNRLWGSLQNWKSKRKRKLLYRNELDISIRNITECVKARIVLTLGHDDVVFQWSEQELESNREELEGRGVVLPTNIIPRYRIHNNAIEGDFYRERRDDPFRITHSKEDIRKVVYVMDTYSVPYPAYHELHMLSKGFLPALNYIKQQKKELSTKLDHYLVDGVSLKT